MAADYFTEDQKMAYSPWPQWTADECAEIQNILNEKGYWMNCVYRVGCDRKYHDAWQVNRADVPRLIEQLFRHRFAVEVQAEGKGMASINFCYDYHADDVIRACEKFWKNDNEETRI